MRRNTKLLYLIKPLDERELLHEVSELKKNHKTEVDITFHVCANFARQNEGESVVQTIRLIRKLFPSDISFHYPTFVYGQIPRMNEIVDETKKYIWRNLVKINNAVSDFIECRLLSTVYLYNDETQNSLAEFIFNICHSNITFDKLSARLKVNQTELIFEDNNDNEEKGVANIAADFPPIFGTFNAYRIRYPEQETLTYLRYYYLYSTLLYALPEVNTVSSETCNTEVNRILALLPISIQKLCLQENSFINMNTSLETKWQEVDSFWKENIELQTQGLSDIPRTDWLMKIRQRIDSIYQSRFRNIGVDFFFKLENNRTSEYCNVFNAIITEEFERTIKMKPFTPEAQKNIVRGIVNVFQQKVLEIQKIKKDSLFEIELAEKELNAICENWKGLSILSRLRGKDREIMFQYRNVLTNLMINKTLVPGCDFAVKFLNELIPEVSALHDKCENVQKIFGEAIRATEIMLKETDPSKLYGIFGNKELVQAKVAIEADTENLLHEYLNIILLIYDSIPLADGDNLLSFVRLSINENADTYIFKQIEECSIPEILGLSIVERISRDANEIGGLNEFIDNMKRKTPITFGIKKTCQIGNKYLLVAPELTDYIEGVEHIMSDDPSQLQLLNIRFGLTLQDLDGFAGQRMFIEPSIF